MLKYYKDENDYKMNKPPKGFINFNQVHVMYSFIDDKAQFILTLQGSERTFKLKCINPNNKEEFLTWKLKLVTAITNSSGYKNSLSMQSYKDLMPGKERKYKFWRFMRLSEQEFLEQVETCDLLLCIRKNEIRNVSGKHKI